MVLLPQLIEIVGEACVTTRTEDLQHYGQDWTRFYQPNPSAVVFVRDAAQLQALVRFARKTQTALVPSGGRTGLSAGACATNGEVVVSFDRMDQILDFDAPSASVTVEAGVVTARLQEFAVAQGLYYPVDFASSGSSQIGGNVATNAGGIRVIRYGMTRDQVTGLKVVTGKGELLEVNKGLVKNNTGFDLRHLFVGSEGTLGFVVEATLKLVPAPAPASVMLLSISRMQDCQEILARFRRACTLNAFEFFSQRALDHVMDRSGLAAPFAISSPYYVLLEVEQTVSTMANRALQAFEECVAGGWVTDGIVAGSEQQNRELWQYRERISESITPLTPYKNDISVRISQIPAFLEQADALVKQHYPSFEVVWFGHIGDGNLHLNILKPQGYDVETFKMECEQVSELILQMVQSFGGSISAEHGVGLLKKSQLHFTRSELEIETMRSIKQVFDPDQIMNPGKLI